MESPATLQNKDPNMSYGPEIGYYFFNPQFLPNFFGVRTPHTVVRPKIRNANIDSSNLYFS